MFILQCLVFSLQFVFGIILCVFTVCTVKCAVITKECVVWSVQCWVCSVDCGVLSVQCWVWSIGVCSVFSETEGGTGRGIYTLDNTFRNRGTTLYRQDWGWELLQQILPTRARVWGQLLASKLVMEINNYNFFFLVVFFIRLPFFAPWYFKKYSKVGII